MNVTPFILLITLGVATCSSVLPSSSLNQVLFDGSYEFYDLTYPFDSKTIYWPGTRGFEFTKMSGSFREEGVWYAANEFCTGEHGGTHLDAPFHFNINGSFVGDLPITNLITPLIIVDLESRVNEDPNFILYKHHLDFMLNNCFGADWNCTLIFKFGWSKHYNDPMKYLGGDGTKDSPLRFPGLSPEIAEWIVSSYPNIVGIGVDTASVDPGSSSDFLAHRILNKAGIYILENVKLLEKIPESSCTAFILPMKISRGTGAPLRMVAICPK